MVDAVDAMIIAPDSHLPDEGAAARTLMMGAAVTTTITVLVVDRDLLATEDVTLTTIDVEALALIAVTLLMLTLIFPDDMEESWVERAFIGQNLRVQVMFLSPHYPRDAVIHRQVLEGVHAVVELDYRAQQTGLISLQVFDRSAGRDNVRYDQYQDLDPNVAASLVTRTKSQAQLQPAYGTQYPPANPYAQATQQPPYLPASYPGPPYPGAYPSVGAPPSGADAAIQQILGSLHGNQGRSQGPIPGQPADGAPADVSRLLANAGRTSTTAPFGSQFTGYPPVPSNGTSGASSGDSSRHVHDIMAQLAQFRQ
ncbi:hypothetical protein Hte_008279 [Hypoxylon texense]